MCLCGPPDSEYLRQAELPDEVTTAVDDYGVDPLESGIDLVFLSAITHGG